MVMFNNNLVYNSFLQGEEAEEEEEGESGVSIASLTVGCPAQKSGKIFVRDKLLQVSSPLHPVFHSS